MNTYYNTMRLALERDLKTLGLFGRNPSYLSVVGLYYKNLKPSTDGYLEFQQALFQILDHINKGVIQAQIDC